MYYNQNTLYIIAESEEQAKAIEWFIEETDIDYYIEKAIEVNEEIG